MASKGLGLKQTKGTFELRGIITGVSKPTFFTEKNDKNGNPFRTVNFGVQVTKDSVVYLSLNGMTQEKVYFSKNTKEEKNTIAQPWNARNSFRKEGYRLIGTMLGLEKTVDDKGKEVNDKRTLVPFDACAYIQKNMKDGMSVYVRGNVEYSHFKNQTSGDVQRSVKLTPTQISACAPVDFDAPDYEVKNYFTQEIVFMALERELDEKKAFVKATLEATIVGYNTLESAVFVVEKPALAKNLNSLKPYTFLEVAGEIQTVKNTDEVTEEADDGWGGSNPMKRLNSPYKRVFVIQHADPKSIDTETYSEKILDQALKTMTSGEKSKEDFNTNEWNSDEAEEESGW